MSSAALSNSGDNFVREAPRPRSGRSPRVSVPPVSVRRQFSTKHQVGTTLLRERQYSPHKLKHVNPSCSSYGYKVQLNDVHVYA